MSSFASLVVHSHIIIDLLSDLSPYVSIVQLCPIPANISPLAIVNIPC